MPTYVYECPGCGEIEVQQGITEPALQSCPTCGAAVRRLIAGGTSFLMKGSRAPAGRGHCERESPCCGRETRCDKPPCGE